MTKLLSKIGIGTYRFTLGSPRNEAALRLALQGKTRLNVIDTSPNYSDGGSERLIGQVVREMDKRNDIFLVSKVGYIQNSNLDMLKNGEIKIPKDGVVQFNDEVLHSIHPDFIRDQLDKSLERLETTHLDSYLLHNPEYYLMAHLRSPEDDVKGVQAEMERQIGQAFVTMEEMVAKGKIKSYGISSNSFSLPPDHIHFLPYVNLPELAKDASQRVHGSGNHSFKTIQMPANLLEREALVGIIPWAKKDGRNLTTLINRPLNAFTDEAMFRLASYPPLAISTKDMYEITIKFFEDEKAKTILQKNEVEFLQAMIEAIHKQVDLVKTPFHFEQLQHQVLQAIVNNIEELKPQWVHHLQQYLTSVDQHARNRNYQETLVDLKALGVLGKNWEGDLTEYSTKWLLHQPGVDVVLMGLTRQEYVQFAWKILES